MKKLLLGLFLLTFVGLPLALVLAVSLCFQDEPLVRRTTALTPDDVERGARILEAHDPRTMKGRHAADDDDPRRRARPRGQLPREQIRPGSSRIVLQPGVLSLAASVEVPANPLGRYVNVQALLRETGGLPAVEELRIGRLPVPGFVADWALAHALKSLDRTERSTRSPPIRSRASASPTAACASSTSGATICPRAWETCCWRRRTASG